MFVMRTAVFCCVITVAFGSLASAQGNSANADLAEISAYKLSLPVMKQVAAATRALIAGAKNDPRFQRIEKMKAELETMAGKEEPSAAEQEKMLKMGEEIEALEQSANLFSGNKSLNEIDAAAKRDPLLSGALQSAGISAREYAKFIGALLQAAMIHGFQKAGTIKELPKEANLDNIKFVEQHASELEAFMKEMQAMDKKQP